MTRRFFDDTTVETAMRSSIEYKYTTINNFDENIDDSLATLDNIVIMRIKTTTTASLRAKALRSMTTTTSLPHSANAAFDRKETT